jgi:hypothetical protein
MVNIRLTRFIRRHYRAALVWAVMPLAVLTGRTVVGCGCFGHFESACHCGCCSDKHDGAKQGESACSCCTGHGFTHSTCCCCNKAKAKSPSNITDCKSHDSCPASDLVWQGHRCTSIVVHDVIPVTVAPSADVADLHSSIFVLPDYILSPSSSQSFGQAVDFDTGPPPADLVVTLRRLVI